MKNFFFKEWQTFSKEQKNFFWCISLAAFCITFEYGVTRPASNALFITHFSGNFLPYVWLATIPINFILIYSYDLMLRRFQERNTFLFSILLVIFCNVGVSFFIHESAFFSFAHTVFKDIYILLMFKQLWSLIHSRLDTTKTKLVYSSLFGIGALGSVFGSFFSGYRAAQFGSHVLLRNTFFSYGVFLVAVFFAFAALSQKQKKENLQVSSPFSEVLREIFQSKYLFCVLAFVVMMQLSIAFIDYQFHVYLTAFVPSVDARTSYGGKVINLINLLAVSFYLLGGVGVIHFLGLKKTHTLVPTVLLVIAFAFFCFPLFSMISLCLVAIKFMDFTFFGVGREMLYGPLTRVQKYRTKVIIDVFVYRSTKGGASLVLLGLQKMQMATPYLISSISLALFCAWIFLAVFLFKEEKTTMQEA